MAIALLSERTAGRGRAGFTFSHTTVPMAGALIWGAGPGRLPGPWSQTMDLLWRILLLLAASAADEEGGAKVRAALGKNVTLTCSFSDSVIRWFMEIHQGFRVCIVHVADKDNLEPCLYNLGWKYVSRGNVLSITGVTADDYRRYFCAKITAGKLTFKDTFQVVSGEDAFRRSFQVRL